MMVTMRPKLRISRQIYTQWSTYVKECATEIISFGYTERVGPMEYRLTKLILCKQTASASHAELDADAWSQLLTKEFQEGRDPENIHVHLHSHADMGVFWSGTDEATINEHANSTNYFISVVSNKKGEHLVRFDLYEPIRLTANMDIVIEDLVDQALIDRWKKDVEENVVKPQYRLTPHDMPFTRTYESYEDYKARRERESFEEGGFPVPLTKKQKRRLKRMNDQREKELNQIILPAMSMSDRPSRFPPGNLFTTREQLGERSDESSDSDLEFPPRESEARQTDLALGLDDDSPIDMMGVH